MNSIWTNRSHLPLKKSSSVSSRISDSLGFSLPLNWLPFLTLPSLLVPPLLPGFSLSILGFSHGLILWPHLLLGVLSSLITVNTFHKLVGPNRTSRYLTLEYQTCIVNGLTDLGEIGISNFTCPRPSPRYPPRSLILPIFSNSLMATFTPPSDCSGWELGAS